MEIDDKVNDHAWMQSYERTWEQIKEDQSGSIKNTIANIENLDRMNLRLKRIHPNRSCMTVMRHIIIIIDITKSMNECDLHPNRLEAVLKNIEIFLDNFFDQNPISQIAIITISDLSATIQCNLTSEDSKLRNSLEKISMGGSGVPSIQSALELSIGIFDTIPTSSSREILILFGSSATCDAGDIHQTFKKLSLFNICVSVISFCSEMYVLKTVTEITKGKYFVAYDEHHFRDCLSQHIYFPRESVKGSEFFIPTTLIRMGFPSLIVDEWPSSIVCQTKKLSHFGYFCPQCNAKYPNLPTECKICGLLLVIAPHLARSYQRFFPLQPFIEETSHEIFTCELCQYTIDESCKYKCPTCLNYVCNQCDICAHDNLGFCPLCKILTR